MTPVYVYLRHRVKDYTAWREGYDIHAPARQAAGATGQDYIMRNADDHSEITIIMEWHDMKQARSFTQSVSLKHAMQHAGVIGSPEIRFLESIE